MTKSSAKRAGWLSAVAIVIGAVVALASVGFVMPWQAISRAEAAEVYETKEHAAEVHSRHDREIERSLGLILEKLKER